MLTDIHCHILPAIDDGASDNQETKAMLKKAYQDGIRRMIATPHYHREMFEPSMKEVYRQYSIVKEWAREAGPEGIRLDLGCEYYRDSDVFENFRKRNRPTLAGSQYVLLEFSPSDAYSRIREVVYRLLLEGFIPIIAHAERYQALVREKNGIARIEDLCLLGGQIQLNADAVLGKEGFRIKNFCKKLLELRQVSFIASDCHNNDLRPSRLKECALYIEKKWGKEYAVHIFEENPSKIVGT
ncbi:MAG: hypothetical protein Q4B70_05840 [Lachnospiraceae bacterium]|nr:hypothetical protein [Lachnospiraceae bacterium]